MRSFIFLFALACAGCGIFDPRPVEQPALAAAVDPLNFAQILTVTSIRFSKLSYEDLFNAEFVYYDATGIGYDRATELSRLSAIDNHSSYDTFSVAWGLDTNYSDPQSFSRTEPVTIYRKYTAFARPRGGAVINFSGTSRFVLSYLDNNFWTISRWDDGGVPSSPFNPLYKP
ncbi:MAG: hypothetical protein PHC61_03095 [Chitinivibrionales bacterium]|nr:hypothetical protein [Chitinivibrionales bacterium]